MMGLALVAMVGTGVGLRAAFSPWLPAAAAAGFVALSFVFHRRHAGTWCLHAGVLLAFVLAARLTAPDVDGRSLASVMEQPEEHVAAIGVISDDPVRSERGGDVRWRYPIQLEGVRRAASWQRAAGRLLVTTPDFGPDPPAYGQRLLIHGRVRLDSDPRWGSQHSILGTVRPDREGVRALPGFHGHLLLRACLRGREACARMLRQGIEDDVETTGLLSALMLGYREDLPGRSNNAFARTGTLHIVAISGSHVGIMAMLLVALLKSMGWSRPHWVYAVAPLLILYTLATGMAASALRACLMAVVFWSAGALRRRPDGPTALSFAALVILAVAPGQLADPGFLLSFGVVGGLMVFCPPIMEPLERWVSPDPWKIEAERWPVRALRWCAREGVALAALTVAAWFASTPLTARFFHLVSPVGLVANLVVVPLSIAILLTGCLTLVTGPFSAALAEIFNHANRVFVGLVLRAVEWFDRWPGGSYFVEAPPWALIALTYALMLLLAFGRWKLRCASLSVVLLLAGWGVWRAKHEDRVRVDVIPTVAGVSLFVNLPGDDDVLVDPGLAYEGHRLLKFLHGRGVDRLKAVVLSRSTVDVAAGLPGLMASCPIEEVWTVPPGRSSPFRDVLQGSVERGVSLREIRAGDSGDWPGRVAWQVLHPRGGTSYPSAADQALVLRVARGEGALLFSSEGRASTEAEAVGGRLLSPAPIWVVGRVSRADIGTSDWMEAARPRQIFLRSSADFGAFAQDEMAERLRRTGADVDWIGDTRGVEIALPLSGREVVSDLDAIARAGGGWPRR
jgi:ComEC/Rec2-related protein